MHRDKNWIEGNIRIKGLGQWKTSRVGQKDPSTRGFGIVLELKGVARVQMEPMYRVGGYLRPTHMSLNLLSYPVGITFLSGFVT